MSNTVSTKNTKFGDEIVHALARADCFSISYPLGFQIYESLLRCLMYVQWLIVLRCFLRQYQITLTCLLFTFSYTARPVFSPVMSPKQRRSMSPQHSPDRSPQPTPPRSPVSRSPVSRSLVSRSPVSRSPMSSPPLSPARSKENVYDDDIDYESDLGSDY